MLHQSTISEQVLRPTIVEVDLSAITYNLAQVQTLAGNATVMCILKANAYGHGLVRIAQHLDTLGVQYYGVAYLEEGIMLREAGILTPILVMGGIIGDQIPLFIKYDLTITASSIDKLSQIEIEAQKLKSKAKVHIKIDTGMERIGVHYYSAQALIEKSWHTEHTIVEGIFSHFANADSNDADYTHMQIERFEQVLSLYGDRPLPQWVHISNSAGTVSFRNENYNMVRCGIMLYGVLPNHDFRTQLELKPALSWKTRIVYFKVIQPNHPVSYGSKWQADKMTRVVTLPLGYGDGYFRSMTHKAQVILRGKRYSVIGAICMDQMMVDIGWDSGYNGDEVLLIGQEGDQNITVEELAEWADTIPYEILTNINTRVQRIYI